MAKTNTQPVWSFGEEGITKAPWMASNALYLAGQAAIDAADALAVEMERKWGVGRLRLLVTNDLRERFDRQRLKFNHAIRNGDLTAVQTEAGRMCAAWRFLDQTADAAGSETLHPQVWEFAMPDGTTAAIVRDSASAAHVFRDERAMAVYTLEEIARLLAGFPTLAKAKELWGGAEIIAAREPRDPLEAVEEFDDSIPF